MPEPGAGATIRAARPDEAGALSDLALRSKAHWGYDAAFIEACREELTVSAGDVEHALVMVLDDAGRPGGFYLMRDTGRPGTADLDLFYLEPELIGAGHGRRLWNHVLETAAAHGYRRVTIDSDPHAEGFYLAMGARRVGEAPSGSIPGRTLPLLQFDLDEPE